MAQPAEFRTEAFLVAGGFEKQREAVDAAGDRRALEALAWNPEGMDHVRGAQREVDRAVARHREGRRLVAVADHAHVLSGIGEAPSPLKGGDVDLDLLG